MNSPALLIETCQESEDGVVLQRIKNVFDFTLCHKGVGAHVREVGEVCGSS